MEQRYWIFECSQKWGYMVSPDPWKWASKPVAGPFRTWNAAYSIMEKMLDKAGIKQPSFAAYV